MGRTRVPIRWLRPARDGAVIAMLLLALAHVLGESHTGGDAISYWLAKPLDPYTYVVPGVVGAYLYSPAFTQAIWPLHYLSWDLFAAVTTIFLASALVWQAGLWTAAMFFSLPVLLEVIHGNIHLLLGAAIVVGFRWPSAWCVVLLTKVTPGIGLLWFVARRDWRGLALAGGATAVVVAVSFAISPSSWWEWLDVLAAAAAAPQPGATIAIPLPLRIAVAAALVIWGARTDRPWTVVVASTIALPVLWINGLAMLVALIPLLPDELGSTPASRFLAAGHRGRPSAARPRLAGSGTAA